MSRRKSGNKDSAPQISFTNWILGGPLITTSRNSTIERVARANAAKAGRAAQLENAEKKDEEKKEEEKPADKPAEEEKKAEGEEAKKEDDASKSDDKPEGDKPAEEKPAEEKPADNAADNNGFTEEQDAKILAMKAENKTWKIISMELSRSKNDVMKRFKELKEKDAGAATETEQKGDEKPAETEKKDDKGKGKGKATDKSPSAKGSVAGGDEGKGDTAGELKRLKPDNIWSTRDCEILEYLEARYDSEKWLNMQANFYNHTGRMIIADIIEQKFRQDT